MIQVNGNHHASCNACGKRPDVMNVHLSHYETDFTLCAECGISLLKSIAGWMGITSPKWKKQIDAFFKGKPTPAAIQKRGER